MNDELLTLTEVAEYLKFKPQTVYRWTQSGKLPGAKFGKEWRFRKSDIKIWLDKQFKLSKTKAGV